MKVKSRVKINFNLHILYYCINLEEVIGKDLIWESENLKIQLKFSYYKPYVPKSKKSNSKGNSSYNSGSKNDIENTIDPVVRENLLKLVVNQVFENLEELKKNKRVLEDDFKYYYFMDDIDKEIEIPKIDEGYYIENWIRA